MRVLVCGGSGFLGQALCRFLQRRGEMVYVLSRHGIPGEAQALRADLAEPGEAEDVLKRVRPDVIINACGLADASPGLDRVWSTFRDNTVAAVALYGAAAKIGCERVLHCGSLQEPMLEQAPASPASPYTLSKLAASLYARFMRDRYQLPLIELRFAILYGPGPQPERKLIPYVIQSLLRGESPEVGHGEQRADWLYVEDAAEAAVAALSAADAVGERLTIGSGQQHSVRELVETIARLIGSDARVRFAERGDRLNEAFGEVDLGRLSRSLAWAPRTSIEQGLRQTIAWYQACAAGGARLGAAIDARP